ncbi:hypothetical protein SSCG_05068 [Streptomyces clavuligerus]|nr:hypothetical protein SSCG_05068 [Streptomyces clavuligerus]
MREGERPGPPPVRRTADRERPRVVRMFGRTGDPASEDGGPVVRDQESRLSGLTKVYPRAWMPSTIVFSGATVWNGW